MNERRKHQRFQFSYNVYYSAYAEGDNSVKCECKTSTMDVSKGGTRVALNKALGLGKKYYLNIASDSSENPVKAVASIVWERSGGEGSTEVGMEFDKIGWTESDRLITSV